MEQNIYIWEQEKRLEDGEKYKDSRTEKMKTRAGLNLTEPALGIKIKSVEPNQTKVAEPSHQNASLLRKISQNAAFQSRKEIGKSILGIFGSSFIKWNPQISIFGTETWELRILEDVESYFGVNFRIGLYVFPEFG